MTNQCKRLMDRLGQPLDAELSAHVREHPSCKAVVSAYEALARASSLEPSDRGSSIAERALAEVASHPVARAWWWDAALAAGTNLVVLIVVLLAMSRKGVVINAAPPANLWMIGILLAGSVLAGPVISIAPGRRSLRVAGLALLALIPLAVVLGGSGLGTSMSWIKSGNPCFTTEVVTSVAPLAAALWALTRSAFQVRRAVMGTAAAAAVGVLVLHLHCDIGSASHLLFFHVLPWALLVAAAVAIRFRLPSRSFAP